jgi:hypothetical protein
MNHWAHAPHSIPVLDLDEPEPLWSLVSVDDDVTLTWRSHVSFEGERMWSRPSAGESDTRRPERKHERQRQEPKKPVKFRPLPHIPAYLLAWRRHQERAAEYEREQSILDIQIRARLKANDVSTRSLAEASHQRFLVVQKIY